MTDPTTNTSATRSQGHPLEMFTHCPVCGAEGFSVINVKAKRCPQCGFTYYANPCSATAAFIVRRRKDDDGQTVAELLVGTRGKEPARGTLDLPGGFCDM